jgi:hypothetical protein
MTWLGTLCRSARYHPGVLGTRRAITIKVAI